MVDLLRPRDIIESAAVPGHPGLYVVGSYDRRITFYSQQVRPLEEIAGRPHPRFLISGNGDGALIDMVAAGSAAFDHARMIRTIVTHPGISEIFAHLRSIDERARAADGRGERFDFVAAYDTEILPAIEAIGILGAVAGLLRPGVHLTLQTQHPEMFVVTTSALNRLAAYLMTKVCLRAPQSGFLHLHCADVRVVEPPRDRTYQALYWLDCGGTIVGADSVIVRRGPDRASSRAPFDNVLAGFEAAHTAWLTRHGDATHVPRLSPEARELFEIAAKTANIPLARHVQEARAAIRIETVQVRPIDLRLRWSGTLAPQDMVAAWRNDGARFDIVCPAPPEAYGPVAAAIIRLAAHAQQCKIIADPGQWRQFAGGLSSESLHAEGLRMPNIEAGIPGAVNRDPVELDPIYLASALHDGLDRWTIDAIDRHIDDYLATGRDASARVGFVASLALRHQMRSVWQGWKVNFDANPALLARFFRLLTCALDDDGSIETAHVLVGPAKLTPLIRGTAVALAIATGWQTTAPHLNRPGNLLRQRDNATTWSGHSCAADQIDGKAMSLAAASFMWRTQFVILSVRGSVDLASQAEERFSITKSDQPGISDPAGAGQILMSIDAAFIAAAEAGPAALVGLLERVERTHFERLEAAIVIMAPEDERA